MEWIKLGQIYQVNNDNPYLLSHAANPLAHYLEDNIYRIYYNGRDKNNKSSVSYVDIDIITQDIVNDPKTPILTYGSENSFYSHGISIGNIWEKNKKEYIGFMGWQCPNNAHWRGDIGVFPLDLSSPPTMLLGINEEDKISLSYPWIMFDEGIYKMWYGSTINWSSENGEMIHIIKYATSLDGENWIPQGQSLYYNIGIEQAFSRPNILKINDYYHMWYSYRSGDGTPYRIGYAESKDGKSWLKSSSNISVSKNGWDSEMICYPYVFKHKNEIYMLYNGNSFGKEGFGLSKLKIN